MAGCGLRASPLSKCFLHPCTGKLYGKDGVAGGQQLLIIALLDVTFKLDGECVHDVPVFVQPGSSQACLLGN